MPYLLLQTIFMPLAAAVLILFFRSKNGHHAAWIAAAALGYNCLLLCLTGMRIYAHGILFYPLPMGAGVSLNLLADGLSLPIALVVNIICLALCVYSFHYVDHRIEKIYANAGQETRALYFKRFFFLYLFFPAGFTGVVFCTNLIFIYVFLELLTIVPLYFIMAQFGYSDFISRYRVALICLFWGMAGALLFLVGILLGFNEIGSFEIAELGNLPDHQVTSWVIVFILAGLCTKLAIVPLHAWMPWVHAEHPTCIAGLLAIYANIAVYIAVRVLFLPLQEQMPVFRLPLMVLSLVTMIYGALLTLSQTDIKRFCACSTISQISYSVFGISAMTLMGIKGGLFYFLSHIIGKAVLFSTAGMVVWTTGIRDMRKLGGLGKKMPVTAGLWITAALILSALPPTSGFVGKWLFFTGAFQACSSSPQGVIFVTLAVLSTLLTLVYTFTAGFKIFFGPLKPNTIPANDPPFSMSLPIIFLAVCAIFLGLFPEPVLNLFDRVLAAALFTTD